MTDIIHVFSTSLPQMVKLWLVLWGLMNFTPVKKKYVYSLSGISVSVLLVILGIYRRYYWDLVTSLCLILVLVAVCFLFDENIFKKIIYSLLVYTFILFLDTCIIGIGSALDCYPDKNSRFYELGVFLYSMIGLVLLAVLVWLKRKKIGEALPIRVTKRIYALMFTGACTGILFIIAIMASLNSRISDMGRRTMLVITIILFISYFAACLMIIIITESRDNYKALSLINQRVIESQQQYYTLVNEKQKEIRSIRHEMKNHLACIHGLYQTDKLPEMEQYISQLIEAYDISNDLFDTGNDIVNAILNDAQSRNRKKGIILRVEGGFPEELHIASMDLCVIFANMVSNAVEAIERLEKKDNSFIDIRISSYKDELYIDVHNPVGNSIEIFEGRLMTSKKDKNLHGFGVKNIIQRVKKYQGTYEYKIENDYFTVEIYMKNRG